MTPADWFRRRHAEAPSVFDGPFEVVRMTGNEATLDPGLPPVRCSILPAEPPPEIAGCAGPAAEFIFGVPAEECSFTAEQDG